MTVHLKIKAGDYVTPDKLYHTYGGNCLRPVHAEKVAHVHGGYSAAEVELEGRHGQRFPAHIFEKAGVELPRDLPDGWVMDPNGYIHARHYGY